MIRRTDTIDFPRYNPIGRKGDGEAFGNLLTALAEYSGVAGVEQVVRDNPRLLFKASLGLIGMLKPLFTKACGLARLHDRPPIIEDFQKSMVAATRRQDLLAEIEQGEALFRNSHYAEDELEARLGISEIARRVRVFQNLFLRCRYERASFDGDADSDAASNNAGKRRAAS